MVSVCCPDIALWAAEIVCGLQARYVQVTSRKALLIAAKPELNALLGKAQRAPSGIIASTACSACLSMLFPTARLQ